MTLQIQLFKYNITLVILTSSLFLNDKIISLHQQV
jgi:hypothetical protein